MEEADKVLAEAERQAQTYWDFMSQEEREQYAWLAGIIDGEGMIAIVRGGGKGPRYPNTYYQLETAVTMSHKITVERIRQIAKHGSIRSYWPTKGTKLAYTWAVRDKASASILRCLLPFLVTKKEQALLGLQFFDFQKQNSRRDYTPAHIAKLRVFWEQMRELNASGKGRKPHG